MLNIPAVLFTKYSILLNKKSVPVSVHNNYKKWLRFYLDLSIKTVAVPIIPEDRDIHRNGFAGC